jgi:hypothetical protein
MNFAASSAVTACREEGADVSPRTVVKPASVKQEPEREAFAYVHLPMFRRTVPLVGRSGRPSQ